MQQAVKGEQCFALYFDNNTQEIYYSSNQNKQLTANFQLFADFKAKNLTGTAQAQI